jgi:glyoxylate reductase
MKVFLTRELPEIAFCLLDRNKINHGCYEQDSPIPRKRLLKEVQSCDGLVCLLTEQIDKEVIDKMEHCKIIANYAVGFNNIDVNYAKRKGIIVTNTPDVLTESTADLTMALVLACARRLTEGEKFLKEKKYKAWKPGLLLGTELKNKTFGVIGAGRIGTATSLRAKAFGTNIIYHSLDRNIHLENTTGAKKVTLNFLLKHSDIISIHLPLNKNTHHYFDDKKFRLVKHNVILVNTSRGELIDEKYLIKYLREGRFNSIGLDVFENEPDINPELLKFSNVIILPHLGSATKEARSAMAELAVSNVINVLKNKPPLTPVI